MNAEELKQGPKQSTEGGVKVCLRCSILYLHRPGNVISCWSGSYMLYKRSLLCRIGSQRASSSCLASDGNGTASACPCVYVQNTQTSMGYHTCLHALALALRFSGVHPYATAMSEGTELIQTKTSYSISC